MRCALHIFMYTVSLWVLSNDGRLFAQVNLYPSHYGFAKEASKYYNPALLNQSGNISLELGNQFYTGLFDKIENHYLLGAINLSGKDSSRNKNNLGLKFVNEKEGDFISKPRYYLSYAWHTKIKERYFLAAGINFGIAGYVFKATNVSAGGSSSKPDADFGLSFYGDKFCVGFSANQLFNSTIIPKNYLFVLKRFYTFYVDKTFTISEHSALTMYAQKVLLSNAKDINNLGTYITFAHYCVLGSNYYVEEKLTFLAGFKGFRWHNNAVDLLVSYNFPSANATQINTTSFELLLGYRILK